ncbi:MAG: hypothetical protein R2789_16805 [Microthrixaceae bacterium]
MSAVTHPTKFDSVLDLARLPWFTVEGGNRVVLAEGATEEIGPVIDSHTHLAMGFLRRLRIDLHRETPTVAYYLPVTLPVDLELYSNQNLDASAMFAMKADVSVLGLTAQGMRTTHTAPNLVRDMDSSESSDRWCCPSTFRSGPGTRMLSWKPPVDIPNWFRSARCIHSIATSSGA